MFWEFLQLRSRLKEKNVYFVYSIKVYPLSDFISLHNNEIPQHIVWAPTTEHSLIQSKKQRCFIIMARKFIP